MNNGIDYREESPGKEGATDEEILILDTLSFFTKKKKREVGNMTESSST